MDGRRGFSPVLAGGLGHIGRVDKHPPIPRPIHAGQFAGQFTVERTRESIGVEQMVCGDIILIHRLLHQAQAKDAGVEIVIARGIGGDGRQVVI